MKPIAYFNLFLWMLVPLFATGCAESFDYHIANSIFIEDNESPGLPIYSEKGYNSFGVYWGLTPLTTQWGHDQSIILVKNDSCHIRFSGSTGQDLYTLQVSLPGYTPKTFNDLLSLQDQKFDLSKPECAIFLFLQNRPIDFEVKEGLFTVKRVQNMYIDREFQGVVLSGIFSFKANVDGIPVIFSKGRFDMRFGEENFFLEQDKEKEP